MVDTNWIALVGIFGASYWIGAFAVREDIGGICINVALVIIMLGMMQIHWDDKIRERK